VRAVRIYERGGPDVLVMDDVPRPTPGPGQVSIEVRVAGVNYADIGQRQGVYPNLRDLPATLGDEAAGFVAEVGPGVSGLETGQRVVAVVDGGYAEYALASAENVLPLPDDLGFAEAAAIPIQGITADLLLRNAARLHVGESVLVHVAAGGVGSLAVQLARLGGASLIIGSTRTAAKAETIRALGVDIVVNSADQDWPQQVRAATQGRGVDIVLDPIGGETSQGGLASLAPFGRLVIYGGLGEKPTPFVAQQLIRDCLAVSGYNTQAQPVDERVASGHRLARAIARGDLRVLQGLSYPLAEAASAHRALAAGESTGKIVLTTGLAGA